MASHMLVTYVVGLSVSIFSAFVVVVGFTLAYSEEQTRRAEFMLTNYQAEIIAHLRGRAWAQQLGTTRGLAYKARGWVDDDFTSDSSPRILVNGFAVPNASG